MFKSKELGSHTIFFSFLEHTLKKLHNTGIKQNEQILWFKLVP